MEDKLLVRPGIRSKTRFFVAFGVGGRLGFDTIDEIARNGFEGKIIGTVDGRADDEARIMEGRKTLELGEDLILVVDCDNIKRATDLIAPLAAFSPKFIPIIPLRST